MSVERDEEEVVKELKVLLDRSAEQLDSRTELRLRQVRRDALLQLEPGKRRNPFRSWAAAGSFAAIAAVIGVSVWFATVERPVPVAAVDDVEIVASQEPLEVYEDLEFYRWLAKKEMQGG